MTPVTCTQLLASCAVLLAVIVSGVVAIRHLTLAGDTAITTETMELALR